MIRLHTPFLAAALFTGVAAVGLTPALAQTASAPANAGAAPSEARHHAMARMPGQFVDGRMAFFKAELKITPAQEAQWQQVEAAMRENAKTLDQTITTAQQNRTGTNAIQRLELRDQFAKVRSDNDDRFLAAFKPLYASLSPEQQRMADQLIGPPTIIGTIIAPDPLLGIIGEASGSLRRLFPPTRNCDLVEKLGCGNRYSTRFGS